MGNMLMLLPYILSQVPNGVGCGLGALQLILYFIYRDNKGEAKKPIAAPSLEMGPGKVHQEKQVVEQV